MSGSSPKCFGIGSVAKQTGIPVSTLRTWERRYGFPEPVRCGSGYRRYDQKTVERLHLLRELLQRGHRPSVVVPLDMEQLRGMVGSAAPRSSMGQGEVGFYPYCSWFDSVYSLNGKQMEAQLHQARGSLGMERFLRCAIVPFLREIGNRWEEGRLNVCHEHFASEVVRDFVSRTWRELNDFGDGPLVVCAGLPGERHSIPLHISAAILTLNQTRVTFVGADVPPDTLLHAVEVSSADAVLLGSSKSAQVSQVNNITQNIRMLLDDAVGIALGGAEADPEIPGVEFLKSFDDVRSWSNLL